VNFCILFGLTVALLLVIGAFPGFAILWVIPLAVVVVGLAAGLGIFFGVLNVFMRDIGQAATVLLNLWFWVTPIVYPINIVPERLMPFFKLNPMLPVVSGFHEIFLSGTFESWPALVPVAMLALVALALAYVVFKRAGPDMVDVL
jgi:lipopolysaccharide transport system permease protein